MEKHLGPMSQLVHNILGAPRRKLNMIFQMSLLVLCYCWFAAAVTASPSTSSSSIPHYFQCDSRWGNDIIGKMNVSKGEDSTICRVGCAMTSLSMLLASINTTTSWLLENRSVVTPKTFNTWLQQHNGYDCVNIGTTTEKKDSMLTKVTSANEIVCFDLLSQSISNLTGRITYDGYHGGDTLPSIKDM
jgi:hypothetical protein